MYHIKSDTITETITLSLMTNTYFDVKTLRVHTRHHGQVWMSVSGSLHAINMRGLDSSLA